MTSKETREVISGLARAATSWAGSGLTSLFVVVVALGWLLVGIAWGFPEEWHRWLHSMSALVTVVMVFVIQHTTNQESRAMLVKLDELLRVDEDARGEIMAVENADLSTLERIDREMTEHPHSAPEAG